MTTTRRLLLAAALLLLAGCASIPLSTLWKLRGFDGDDLVTMEPADLRAALWLQPQVPVAPESVRLSLSLDRADGAPERHDFGLEPARGPGPVEPGKTYRPWQLDADGRRALAAVQRQLRAARDAGGAAYEGASFQVSFKPAFGETPPDKLLVSVQLLLDPAQGWFLLLDEAELPVAKPGG